MVAGKQKRVFQMKFYNDLLRVCQKCGAKSEAEIEDRRRCENCGAKVWFFNFQSPPPIPPRPSKSPRSLWKSNLSIALLSGIAILGFVALIGVFNNLVVVIVSALSAIGFAVFGFLRHQETEELETQLENAQKVHDFAIIMEGRVSELTERYKHLLRTGDKRIEHYYKTIYVEAEKKHDEASELLYEAEAKREKIQTVEHRIYAMAERLIGDHLKWVAKKTEGRSGELSTSKEGPRENV